MRLALSFVTLAAIVGLVALAKSKGWFQHTGCTCRHCADEKSERLTD